MGGDGYFQLYKMIKETKGQAKCRECLCGDAKCLASALGTLTHTLSLFHL